MGSNSGHLLVKLWGQDYGWWVQVTATTIKSSWTVSTIYGVSM